MSIGDQGREANLDNALSQSEQFGLSKEKAKEIIVDLVRKVSRRQQHFEECGFTGEEIDMLQPSFRVAKNQFN